MESVTNTEDMSCNVLILAFIVNVSLKSRVREIRKHGSVGGTITRTLILGICYGFYPTLIDNVGHLRATWKNRKGSKRLDTKTLAEEHNEIYKQYLKEGEAYRVFALKQ